MDKKERSIIQKCQQGDRKAYKHIFLEYKDTVYNVALGMLSNKEDAQDMTQEVFIRVFEKINQFNFKSSFSTWLYRVTVNMCKNELRRRKKQKQDAEELKDYYEQIQPSMESPEEELMREERKVKLRQALTEIKEDYRTILVLREMEGMSYKELSEVLKCSVGRVKSRLNEARMELRNKFKSLEEQTIKESNELYVFCS